MDSSRTATGAGRRQAAPHPGPMIVREYLEPLNLDARSLATQIGMDPFVLGAMLAGGSSFDVETAVRLGRALQINPSVLMQIQLAHDFARARSDDTLETISVLHNDGRVTFPELGYLRGRLAGMRDSSNYGDVRFETLGFFADQAFGDDVLLGMHEIQPGVRLRIFNKDDQPVWTGVVLAALDGSPLFPYARPNTWIEWFVGRQRADFIAAVQRPPTRT